MNIGAKARGLKLLELVGANVPPYTTIPVDGSLVDPERILDEHGPIVVVRSSSPDEDGSKHSMAGQFDSVLNVMTANELRVALEKVRSGGDGNPMAVIIQRQVSANRAGVVFTKDPVSGEDHFIIESVEGLGDELMSGSMTPKRTVVSDEAPPHFKELVESARELEQMLGYPLDMEWAVEDEVLWLLQVRPITAMPAPNSGPSYSRVPAEQFYSGPVSPLFFSIFSRLYEEEYVKPTLEALGVKVPVKGFLVRHRNHIYASTRMVHYLKERFPRIIRGKLGEVLPPDERISERNGASILFLVRSVGYLARHPLLWPNRLDELFYKRVVPELERSIRSIGDLSKMTEHELEDCYRKHIGLAAKHIDISKWGLGLYSVPSVIALERFLERHGFTKDVLAGLLQNIVSSTSEAALELRSLADLIRGERSILKRFEQGISYKALCTLTASDDRFLRVLDGFEIILLRHGHRRLGRDIVLPSWKDDPDIPLGLVCELVTTPSVTRLYEVDMKEIVRARLSFPERLAFERMLAFTLRYVRFREQQRYYLDMILSSMRGVIVEVGNRMVGDGTIASLDEVFFLEIDDVIGYLQGCDTTRLDKKALIQKALFEINDGTPGRYLRGTIDFDDVDTSPEFILGDSIAGDPVSRGSYTGHVRVIKDLGPGYLPEPGEIIVTRCIDPGQTHMMMLAGGLIFEVGGILSHGAIMARELGVPTVAGIQNATKLFKNGDKITVDGTNGRIILPS